MTKPFNRIDIDAILFDGEDGDEFGGYVDDATHDPQVFAFGFDGDDDVDFDGSDIFGLDGDDEGFGLDDDKGFGLDDDDDEYGWAVDRPSSGAGRVAMAGRVRDMYAGTASDSDRYDVGFYGGYLQCSLDQGLLSKEDAAERFSGLAKLAGKGLLKGATFLAKQAGTGLREGANITQEDVAAGKVEAGTASHEAGRTLGEWLPGRFDEWRSGPAEAEATEVAVETDAEELPPVYVADSEGVDEALDEVDEGVDSEQTRPFSVSESFGHSFRSTVSGSPRSSTRTALARAAGLGSQRLRRADRSVAPLPLLNDQAAKPLLLSSGKVVEPVYGHLQLLPCPSCSPMSSEAVHYGAHESCGACDGYGAILIPDADVDTYGASYGLALIGLLGSAAAGATARAFDKGAIFPEAREKLAAKLDEESQGWDPEKRALIPKRWRRTEKKEQG